MRNIFNQMNVIINTEGGDEVRGGLFIRNNSGKKEIGIMVLWFEDLENGKRRKRYSELIHFDFNLLFDEAIEEKLRPLLNYGNLIVEDDIRKIAAHIMVNWRSLNKIVDEYKMSFVDMCKILLDNKDGEIDLDGKTYITIKTYRFDEIARTFGWLPIHLKKTLNLNGMLYRNSSRYDYHRRKNESRVICIDKELLEREIGDAEV